MPATLLIVTLMTVVFPKIASLRGLIKTAEPAGAIMSGRLNNTKRKLIRNKYNLFIFLLVFDFFSIFSLPQCETFTEPPETSHDGFMFQAEK